ncbi:hypothetical protein [Paraburkholderia sp. J41]|uniref:MuF-C-terminal domain-containing protein n=1 Tax=Paraburkholderia sp. J41 TaxID=2805433 RepID=UPI002AC320DC|nr:hypothetical protein [Paraburkholderia sp. J41]
MSLPGRIELTRDLPRGILKAYEAGELGRDFLSVQVLIGRLPTAVLTALETPDLNVVTSISILAKILTKHSVPPDIVANLANTVLRPKAVYQSASKGNVPSAVLLLSVERVDGDPLMASVELDQPNATSRANMHWMTSAYPKNNEGKFDQWRADGLLIWEA